VAKRNNYPDFFIKLEAKPGNHPSQPSPLEAISSIPSRITKSRLIILQPKRSSLTIITGISPFPQYKHRHDFIAPKRSPDLSSFDRRGPIDGHITMSEYNTFPAWFLSCSFHRAAAWPSVHNSFNPTLKSARVLSYHNHLRSERSWFVDTDRCHRTLSLTIRYSERHGWLDILYHRQRTSKQQQLDDLFTVSVFFPLLTAPSACRLHQHHPTWQTCLRCSSILDGDSVVWVGSDVVSSTSSEGVNTAQHGTTWHS
jgi:hypothetical protein